MTDTQNTTPTPSKAASERINLSPSQVIASGLAAISSTVAASYFGVAGTVVGAAFGAIITVVGNAVYGHYLRRTRDRVLDLAVAQRFATVRTVSPSGSAPALDAAAAPVTEPTVPRPRYRWNAKRLGLAAAGLFVVIMAGTTAFEFASGQPLSATVTGKHESGITLGGGSTHHSDPSTTPSPTSAVPSSPARSSVTTSGASPTVTVTVTPSGGTSASDSATHSAPDSATPSDSGSSSATGSASPTTSPAPTG